MSHNITILRDSTEAYEEYAIGKATGRRLTTTSKPIGKTYFVSDGAIKKELLNAGSTYAIRATRVETCEEQAGIVNTLLPSETILSTIFKDSTATVAVSQDAYARKSERKRNRYTMRTKECMALPSGIAVLAVDVDSQGDKAAVYPENFAKPISEVEALERIFTAAPFLRNCSRVTKPGSSAFIRCKDDHSIYIGAGSWRFYFLIADGSDLMRAVKALYGHLWLTGSGYGVIMNGPSFQARCLIDMALYNLARLDFAGPPTLADYLERYGRGLEGAVVHQGAIEIVDTKTAIPDLTRSQQARVAVLIGEAKEALAPVYARMALEKGTERVLKRHSKESLSPEQLNKLIQAEVRTFDHKILPHDHVVYVEDPKHVLQGKDDQINGRWSAVTVADIATYPEHFDGKLTLDPFELEYNDHGQVGKIFAKDGLTIFSQAHGGVTYYLSEDIIALRYLSAALEDLAIPTTT